MLTDYKEILFSLQSIPNKAAVAREAKIHPSTLCHYLAGRRRLPIDGVLPVVLADEIGSDPLFVIQALDILRERKAKHDRKPKAR